MTGHNSDLEDGKTKSGSANQLLHVTIGTSIFFNQRKHFFFLHRKVGSIPAGVPRFERAPPCGRTQNPAAFIRAQQHSGAVQESHC